MNSSRTYYLDDNSELEEEESELYDLWATGAEMEFPSHFSSSDCVLHTMILVDSTSLVLSVDESCIFNYRNWIERWFKARQKLKCRCFTKTNVSFIWTNEKIYNSDFLFRTNDKKTVENKIRNSFFSSRRTSKEGKSKFFFEKKRLWKVLRPRMSIFSKSVFFDVFCPRISILEVQKFKKRVSE